MVELDSHPCKCDPTKADVFFECVPKWVSNVSEFQVAVWCNPVKGGCGARAAWPMNKTNTTYITNVTAPVVMCGKYSDTPKIKKCTLVYGHADKCRFEDA